MIEITGYKDKHEFVSEKGVKEKKTTDFARMGVLF